MSRLRRAVLLSALSLVLSSCIYGKVIFPLDTDVQNTRLGPKVGRASAHSVLWLVAWGDAGVDAAAQAGGIKTVQHRDGERTMLLCGADARITTIAYGD